MQSALSGKNMVTSILTFSPINPFNLRCITNKSHLDVNFINFNVYAGDLLQSIR